jgi:hypothetical protein
VVVVDCGGGVVVRRSLEEFDVTRDEFVDGLLIIVIIKRSSVDCGVVGVFRFGNGIFKNDDKFVFGLFDIARDDVDEAGDGVEEIDLTITKSGVNNSDVD